jgi:dTDP-4-amino-4,6-dideoxygalactose transaminase
VRPQAVPGGHRHPYQAYVVVLEDEGLDRDALIAELREQGVESTLGTYALHAEPAFAARCGTAPGDLPHSHRLAERTLTLPLHQNLTDGDVATIAAALEGAMASLAGTS